MKKFYALLTPVLVLFSLISFAQAVHVVQASNFIFTPSNFTAAIGDTVRFVYLSGNNHTTTSSAVPAGALPWDNPLTPAATIFNYIVIASGSYSYFCRPHQGLGMVGSFTVSSVAPVKLIDFSAASSTNNSIKLSWKTATEENSDHFVIQEGFDGINFSDAGTVTAGGNSTSVLNYSFTVSYVSDKQRFVYFRLLTVDKDQKKQYSNILLYRQESTSSADFITSIYPNPAESGDHLHLNFNADHADKLVLRIMDAAGKNQATITLTANEGVNQTHMPLPKLNRGNYYLEFYLNGRKETHSLVIQ